MGIRQTQSLTQIGFLPLVRQLLPFGLAAVLIWYLSGHPAMVDTTRILAELGSITPMQWFLALLATACSFWAVGRYDVVLHRQLGTDVAPAQARRAGIVAIALSQTVGMGLLTGALVRWRMLPSLSLWQCSRLSLAVALSFLAGWSVVAAATVLVLPVPVPFLGLVATLILVLASGLLVVALLRPVALSHLPIPPFRRLVRILALAAADTGAAALAFAILVPEAAGLPLALLLPAFLLALGIGLASGSPGGVGPFEAVLLVLLPATAPEPLLAAVLAFRLCYYVIPAVLAALVLMVGPRSAASPPLPLAPSGAAAPGLLAIARAEAQLTHQGPFRLWSDPPGKGGWLVAETALNLVTLGDPIGMMHPGLLSAAQASAAQSDRGIAHYKCSGRTAAHLRRRGYRVVRCGAEALLHPARFNLDASGCATLRRKCRKAQKAGVSCTISPDGLRPMAEIAAVSASWVQRHGVERGFSMGRFHPDHLPGQKLFLARRQNRVVAFITFHATDGEWSLDLMRQSDDAPDGTMQALMAAAIAAAAAQGVGLLSLAAVPSERPGLMCRLIDSATGAAGLRQFKSGFAPRWQPLYLATPGRLSLAIAAIEIAHAIARPAPLKGNGCHGSNRCSGLPRWRRL